mmetsp:Transcript_43086/g.108292  ORF Transcript_43086/g.108292 Transcript_43086/m.108292 type:complete len:223 (-) Transcript_43086:249-917(-)
MFNNRSRFPSPLESLASAVVLDCAIDGFLCFRFTISLKAMSPTFRLAVETATRCSMLFIAAFSAFAGTPGCASIAGAASAFAAKPAVTVRVRRLAVATEFFNLLHFDAPRGESLTPTASAATPPPLGCGSSSPTLPFGSDAVSLDSDSKPPVPDRAAPEEGEGGEMERLLEPRSCAAKATEARGLDFCFCASPSIKFRLVSRSCLLMFIMALAKFCANWPEV